MSPERASSPADNLNESEWRLLTERLPVMVELAESGVCRRISGAAEILVFPIERGDNEDPRYYLYHAETEDALTIYDIDPSAHQLRVYDKKQFGYLRNFETAGTNFEFDEIVGTTAPNAQNLAGLRVFLRDIQDEEDFLKSI